MKLKIFHKVQEMYLLYINCDFFLINVVKIKVLMCCGLQVSVSVSQ